MPKTATKRPMTLAEYKAKNEKANKDTRSPVAKAVGWDANKTQFIRDLLTGGNDVAGRGMIAGMLGAPGDIAGLAENSLRGLIGKPQVQPWGGSEHIGQTLEQAGLVSDVRRPKTELLASLISPASAAKTVLNAPKTARIMLQGLENLDAPRTMSRWSQKGAIHNIFHGTTPDAAKAIERDGFDLSKSADGSIWFTSNPNIGEVAASGSGGIVRRTLDDEKLKLGGWDEADKYGVDELLSQGYDGLMLDDGGDVVYQVFNPSKLGQPVTAPQPGLLGKMVAPQDEALRVAQALPDNAPMTKLYVSMGGQRFPADNMLDAARKYDMYREQANAGASMLPPVDIVDEAGNVLANFSYNGRLWKGERGAAERIEIDPANWDDR